MDDIFPSELAPDDIIQVCQTTNPFEKASLLFLYSNPVDGHDFNALSNSSESLLNSTIRSLCMWCQVTIFSNRVVFPPQRCDFKRNYMAPTFLSAFYTSPEGLFRCLQMQMLSIMNPSTGWCLCNIATVHDEFGDRTLYRGVLPSRKSQIKPCLWYFILKLVDMTFHDELSFFVCNLEGVFDFIIFYYIFILNICCVMISCCYEVLF